MTFSEQSMMTLLNHMDANMKVDLNGSYRIQVPNGWKSTLQINQNQHILFVKSGSGKYIFEDCEFPLEPGTLIYVSSGCPHYAILDEDALLVKQGLRFDLLYKGLTNVLPTKPFSLGIKVSDLVLIDSIMAKINHYHHPASTDGEKSSCNLLTQFLMSEILNQSVSHFYIESSHHTVDMARTHMMDHIYENLSIEDIATYVGISSRHLRTLFKKKYQRTPKQYQIELKMNYANFLLETTSMTVKDISNAIGYSDPFIFSRQYKLYYNIAPSATRNISSLN